LPSSPSSSSKQGRELEQRLVTTRSRTDLDATGDTGDGHDWHSCQAEWGGIAQEAAARLAVVCAGGESSNRNAGEYEQFVSDQQFAHARTKVGMALAQCGDLSWSDVCAHYQPFSDRRLDAIELARVEASCFPGLNEREDFTGFGPPTSIDGTKFEAESLQLLDGGAKTGNNLWFAIVEKAVINDSESGEPGL
jgi:hypothetical protein